MRQRLETMTSLRRIGLFGSMPTLFSALLSLIHLGSLINERGRRARRLLLPVQSLQQ